MSFCTKHNHNSTNFNQDGPVINRSLDLRFLVPSYILPCCIDWLVTSQPNLDHLFISLNCTKMASVSPMVTVQHNSQSSHLGPVPRSIFPPSHVTPQCKPLPFLSLWHPSSPYPTSTRAMLPLHSPSSTVSSINTYLMNPNTCHPLQQRSHQHLHLQPHPHPHHTGITY